MVTSTISWFRRWGSLVLIFLIIFLIGASLRAYELGEESIWVDEAFTYHYVNLGWKELVQILSDDVHPILFYALGHWWVEAFSNSEVSLRFLPFLFGCLSIVVMFFLVKEPYDTRTALLAMLFFSLSYTMILYSQEAKMYMQFVFFFLLGLWFLIRFMKRPSTGNLVGMSIAHVLLLHTHFLSFVVIPLEVLFYCLAYVLQRKQGVEELLFKSRFDLSKSALFLIISVASYVPWLRIFSKQVQYLFTFVLKEKFLLKFGFDGFYPFFISALIVFLLCLFMGYHVFSSKEYYHKLQKITQHLTMSNSVFVILFIVFLVFNFQNADYYFGNVTYIRYLIFLVPLLHIFLAVRMQKLSRRWFVVVLMVYMVITSLILVEYYHVDGKEQWREAAAYVHGSAGVQDVLVFHTPGHTVWAFNYYFDGPQQQVKLRADGNITKIMDDAQRQGKQNLYLILSHNFVTKDFFKEEIDKRYKLVESKQFIGIDVHKFAVQHQE